MIESYQEEVYKKRNAHAIFWGFVFAFAMLLYMFFQGYYFSVQVGFEKLLHTKGGINPEQVNGTITSNDQFLRKFGIISLQVDPIPQTLTINNKAYQNGGKQLLDYGKYVLEASQNGYLPITLNIELSQENPFYLNTINMVREPVENEFVRIVESIERIGNQYLVKDANKGIYLYNSFLGSGTLVIAPEQIIGTNEAITNTGSTKNVITKSENSLSNGKGKDLTTSSGSDSKKTSMYLGEGYYWNGTYLKTLQNNLTVVNPELTETIANCENPKIISGDVFCKKTQSFLTGKYQNLKEPILEATPDFIRTSSMIIRLGGSFFNSSTPITRNATFSGSTSLAYYKNEPVLINNGILYDIDNGLEPIEIPGLNRVSITKKFGDETITLGENIGTPKLLLEDGKNLPSSITLEGDVAHAIALEQYKGAYIIILPKKALLYYKGSPKATLLASGDMLGIFGTTILYNRDGKTYYILLEENIQTNK